MSELNLKPEWREAWKYGQLGQVGDLHHELADLALHLTKELLQEKFAREHFWHTADGDFCLCVKPNVDPRHNYDEAQWNKVGRKELEG